MNVQGQDIWLVQASSRFLPFRAHRRFRPRWGSSRWYARGEFLQPRQCFSHDDGLRVIGHQQSKLSRRSCRFKCRAVVDDRLGLDERPGHPPSSARGPSRNLGSRSQLMRSCQFHPTAPTLAKPILPRQLQYG